MNRDEIIDLLTAASAYDRRSVGEADVAAWSEAASRANWTFTKALDALHEHFATSAAWLMPGHITQLIRTRSAHPSDTPVAEVLGLPSAPPASASRRAELMAQIRKLADKKSMPS